METFQRFFDCMNIRQGVAGSLFVTRFTVGTAERDLASTDAAGKAGVGD
jgi:hypothetical protein